MTNSNVPIRGSFLFIYHKINMEKEKILSTLSEKVGKTSFSQQTLEAYVDLNPLAEGAEPDDAYWNKAIAFINKMQGQFNADMASQVEDFKKNYKPTPANNEPPKANPEPNKEVEEMRRQLADLTKRLDEKESKQTQEQLMSQVKAEMKKQGATDEYVLKQTLRGVTLDPKKSVADLSKELLTAYDSELTACRGKGAAPRNGGASGGSKDKPFGGYFAQKKAKEGWGKDSK